MRVRQARLTGTGALLALLALATCAASVRAAEETGSVVGTVTDDAGQSVVGLSMRLVQEDGQAQGRRVKVVARVTTGSSGNFTFNRVPPRKYRIEAGSKTTGWIVMDVVVEAGKETRLHDVKLAKQ